MGGVFTMIILSIKTDQPQAELGLFNVQGRTSHMQLAYVKWQAHRKLADTIHLKLQKLLSLQGRALQDVKGIVCFKGPGSFTGLRIGLSVANALADVQGIPVVARQGQNW